MIRLALTGSIGMGKSTTAKLFAARGVPVWDADGAVHRLYGPGGAGAAAVAQLFPAAAGGTGVDRAVLRRLVAEPAALAALEAAIHPLVAADRTAFLAAASAPLVLCDIPLLFETGAEREFEATLLVTAPPSLQRARVLERPGMTEEIFRTLLARQMPDAEKRARATHILETLDHAVASAYVDALIAWLTRNA